MTYCMIVFMRNSRKGKTTVIESRSVVEGRRKESEEKPVQAEKEVIRLSSDTSL